MSDQVRGVSLHVTRTLRRVCLAASLAASLILVSIAYIDRPVARFMAQHVHDRLPFMAMASIANLPAPLATLSLIALALARWSGIPLSAMARLILILAVATLIAIMVKNQLKFDFGRVWPESHPFPGIHNHPSFIDDHVFGFYPFHGGSSYASFPSGHTTAITAPMAVLWMLVPRYRAFWGSLVLIVVCGLIAADFHFVSDTIAGFFLGVGVAAATVSLANMRPLPRPDPRA
ncbi:MAG: phosphatase PAP2 family protein [Acidiphilium sp.]|nr:phosphatase PAP2 family protein [Acidiphilium sp.]MDD4936827.1 phosphatase PAP2 family protein [Acidiphilium sp.]